MLVTRPEQVKKLLTQLDDCEYFAFDTEFVRQVTFYPKVCLMQFASDKGCFAIDVTELMASSAWQDIKGYISEFFSKTNAVLVVHAGEQDMEILNQQFVIPRLLFDTQMAARFIGFAGVPSYGAIVKHYCDVELNKELQFSRWDQRPLSDRHIDYAIRDVSYLHKIYPFMLQQLVDSGKIEWFVEDMASMRRSSLTFKADSISELRQLMGNISSKKQANDCYAVLRARDITARKEDIAKPRLLSTDAIEKRLLAGEMDVTKLPIVHKVKSEFLEVHRSVCENAAEWVDDVEVEWKNRGMIREKKSDKFFAAKDLLAKVALEVSVNPELIASSKDIFKLLENKTSKINHGWRHQIFGEKVANLP